MRVMFKLEDDNTPYLVEAANMAWYPDEGCSAQSGTGTLEIEEAGSGAVWELHSEELGDGRYERYMLEALTRGYADMSKLQPFKLQDDEDENGE